MRKYSSFIEFVKFVYINNKKRIYISFFLSVFVTVIDLTTPQIIRKLLDIGVVGKNMDVLLSLITIYILVNILSLTIDLFLGYLYSRMKNNISVKIRLKILRHIYSLSGKYFTEKKTGNLFSIVQSDVDVVEDVDAELFFSIIKSFFTALLSIYFMFKLKRELLGVIIFLQLALLYLQKIFTIKIHKNIFFIRKEYGEASNILQEYILNIANILVTKSQRIFISNYISKSRSIIKKSITTDILYCSNIAVANAVSIITNAFLYGYGGYEIIKGNFSIGSLIAFQRYSSMLLGPCMNIINANNKIQQAIVSLDRIYSVIKQDSNIKEHHSSKQLKDGELINIKFDNVDFKYNSNDTTFKNTLNSLYLNFDRGKVYAIVGKSGCGKSTIISLLYRLWDVTSGKILINDLDIRDYNIKSIRKNITIVTQNSVIFDATIRENISLGKKIDEQKLLEICNKVGLNEYISTLEKGLDSNIGEMGASISGGQKQRIAIARAMLDSKDILIFDESTSALDNMSQRLIMENLKEYFKDKIVILISHRLSTVEDADMIYVIDEGSVVEQGTHFSLLSNKKEYYNMYKNKFDSDESLIL